MGLPTETPAASLCPQVIAKVFVEQYYSVLHQSPEIAYRFYQNSSIVDRQDSNGVMKSATTPQEINDLLLSLDSKNYIAEILFVDSQQSYKDGVFIQVTGCLTGLDKIRQQFTQSFFLAPQNGGGFFVLNDIFRYVDENQPKEVCQNLANDVSDAQIACLAPEQEAASVQDLHATDPATPPSDGVPVNGEEAHDMSENGGLVVEEEVTVDQPVEPSYIDKQPESEVQEDLPRKSYASIVVKGGTSRKPVYVPTFKARPAPAKRDKLPVASTTPVPDPETEINHSNSNGSLEKNDSNEVVEGHSIYIKNLPFNSTASQVEEELKKFGPIKPGGVQVRNHKLDRFCFGFVEFESVESMQAAIEASSVIIGGRQVFIAQKKTKARVVSVGSGNGGSMRGGRYSMVRDGGGSQNDNFRGGRGNFGGNQSGSSLTRNEFKNNRGGGDYTGRGRGPPQPRGQMVQNWCSKMGRPSTTSQVPVAAA